MELEPGTTLFNRFVITRPLGQGGMATTYLAQDRLWSTEVAVKLLHAANEEILDAFHFEFSTLRGLDHQQLVRVHDLFVATDGAERSEEERLCIYTADYIEGVTLEEHAQGMRWDALRRPLCDALSALHLLHAVGIRHGDFKPDNILLDHHGRGVLIDLGCARPFDLTPGGTISGTPGFIAPELLAGKAVDLRADLYAVGVTMRRLFDLLSSPPPDAVVQLVARLCRPRPAERPKNTEEVLEHLGVETATIHQVAARLGHCIGRHEELSLVSSMLDDLLSGREGQRVAHIVGPEGVGRSRLLREIKWLAQQRCQVIEANASSPDAISRLIAVTSASRSSSTGSSSFEAIIQFHELLLGGCREPTVWVIDDIHLLDEAQRVVLDACLRLVEPTGEMLIVLTSLPDQLLDCTVLEHLELRPFTHTDIARWLGASVSEHTLGYLEQATGGYPAAIASLLRELVSARTTEEELCRASCGLTVTGRRAAMVATLPSDEQRALGLLSILGDRVLPDILERFEVDLSSLGELVDGGLAERDGVGWKLVRAGEGDHLASILDRELMKSLHEEVASWFGERRRDATSYSSASELAAREALHLAHAGSIDGAFRLVIDNETLHPGAPLSWCRVAETLSSSADDWELELLVARLERTAGRTGEALRRVESMNQDELPAELGIRARIELATCRLFLGRTAEAIVHLEELLEDELDPELKAQVCYFLARSQSIQGRHHDAARNAEAGLALCSDAALRADLLEAAGVARSFAGDLGDARDRLDRAAELLRELDDPRRQVRALGSRALMFYNAGELTLASDDHRRSLELAEQTGLVDQVATASLNLGAVCHQRGDWAEALTVYERGLRIAMALGKGSTEALLRFNLAKLYFDLGAFERALLMADGCEAISRRIGLETLITEVDSIRGEVAFAKGEYDRTDACYRRAQGGYRRLGSPREQVEIDLQIAELMIARGETGQATEVLRRCEEMLTSFAARDVELKLDMVRARLLLATGLPKEATGLMERVAQEGRQIGQSNLEAEAEVLAASLWDAQGASTLAEKHRRRAREIWERATASLPPTMREAFWNHPRRAGVARASTAETPPLQSSMRDPKITLLLDINKRLNSSLTTPQVLSRAMDAAIELTRAERGFVLLVDDKKKRELKVAVARNFDRERVERSHVKFSRGIAEQVIESGRPLITADAQSDGRLHTKASVHAMNLTSVLCVPVASPDGVLGALYLDNRFQRGLFTEDDEALLVAFADQVAIALTNARLHDELKRRNRALEAERRRVDELLRDQAEAIDRLTEEVKHHQIPRDHRFDYSLIVGSSRAVEDVFDLLDRVIDTELSVLIQGESGTGKELCARAIHQNSPRATTGRLVSINCGALPETLLESELFGYERGAFTGADQAREGLIVQAQGGTLFLDEIGEMPGAMQVRLLRVLQEREVQPLGSRKTVPVDFRLLCATNRRIRQEVDLGGFREDLFYRISTVEITLPPLRDRGDDIPKLVSHFLSRIATQMNRPVPEITAKALHKLSSYDWPGNVRQLEHVLTKAVVLTDQARITARSIELPHQDPPAEVNLNRKTFEHTEVERIAEALEANRWNISKVSRLLDIPRSTLYRRIERYGLSQRRR